MLSCQTNAIRTIDSLTAPRISDAKRNIDEILRMSNLDVSEYIRILALIRSNSRICLHFHPDRPDSEFRTVAENLLEQGIYRNQFETGLSAGSVSAFPGGERDKWERQVFKGAYHRIGVKPGDRPKYGSVWLVGSPDGPSPRFGSCFLVLKPETTRRATLTYLDSHTDPREKGTIERVEDILSRLFLDAFFNEQALGLNDLKISDLFDEIEKALTQPIQTSLSREPLRNLNQYIEAQVHGPVSLLNDVDYLVADGSFIRSSVGDVIRGICEKYEIELLWNRGICMKVADVPMDFRGPTMPSLAKDVAVNGIFNTRMIGEGVRSLKKDPDRWAARGSDSEVLQEFKLLWHVLVKFGNMSDNLEETAAS